MESEKFQQFIFEMDDVLEHFIKATEQEDRFDYSMESLQALEQYLSDCSKRNDCSGTTVNRAARYLGEVFRKNYGGNWALCLDGPEFLYSGLPVIKNFSEIDFYFCPLAVIENYLKSKKIGLLARAVNSCVNPRKHEIAR